MDSTGIASDRWSVEDHVSLADRLGALLWSRLSLMLGTLAGTAVVAPRMDSSYLLAVALFVLLYAVDIQTRRRLRNGIRPTNRVLVTAVLVEGAALTTSLYLAGGATSAVRYALVIHAGTTALLLSRQIGVRSAVWVSLLLLVSHEMQELGLVPVVDVVDGNRLTPGAETTTLLVAIWAATLLTASASAINERVLLRERLEQHIHASFGQAAEAARAPVETARVLGEHVMRTGVITQVLVVDLRDHPRVLAHVGAVHGESDEPLQDLDGSVLATVRRSRTTQHVRALDPVADRTLVALLGPATNVSVVPMIAGDALVGAVVIVHGDAVSRGVQRRTIDGYQRLAGHGALALANAWAAEALDRQARTDALTGVANRRTFDEQFDKELERARRERSPVSLVLCDVDHFKRFNDTHGHQLGDEVLAEVADTLQRERRPYDMVARYGGEEFVVILSQTDFDGAMRVAERLRRAVAAAGDEYTVTASFGVASSEDGVVSREDLISTADACLYAAKENGRNRVEGARAQLFTEPRP